MHFFKFWHYCSGWNKSKFFLLFVFGGQLLYPLYTHFLVKHIDFIELILVGNHLMGTSYHDSSQFLLCIYLNRGFGDISHIHRLRTFVMRKKLVSLSTCTCLFAKTVI